jgi:hypothetical protein
LDVSVWKIKAMSLSTILVILALIAFVLAAAGWTYKKTDLIAVGLALWSLAGLINQLSHLTLSSVVLLLAFVAFVAAAIGWRYRKISLIAVGLALWTLSIVIPTVIH